MCGINWSSDKLCVKTIAIGSNVVVVYVMMSTREIAKLKTCHSVEQWVQTLFEVAYLWVFHTTCRDKNQSLLIQEFLFQFFKNFEEFRTKKTNNFEFLGNFVAVFSSDEILTSPWEEKISSISFLSFIIFVVIRLFRWESFHCSRWQLNSSKNSC